MSTYYQTKVDYILEDMKLENFDWKALMEELKSRLLDDEDPSWEDVRELKVKMSVISPDFKEISRFYEDGIIKSHELTAVADKMKDVIKSAMTNLANKVLYTINYYLGFKDKVWLTRSETSNREKGTMNSKRVDTIEMHFMNSGLELVDVLVFLKLWNLDEFSHAEKVNVEILVRFEESKNLESLMELDLEKKSVTGLRTFLKASDSEFLAHPMTFEVLKTYMFPEGFDGNAEITIDVAKEDHFPQKRRKISVNGFKFNFHDAITITTPPEKFKEIILQNHIVGTYCSVRSTNDDLLYLLIDIDVPSMLHSMFLPDMIWELTINIAREIINVSSRLGLPPPKVSFSGAKGLHLLYSCDVDGILDDEHQVDLPELSDQRVIPGMSTIRKEKVSSVNDKFKFAKSLLQALFLHIIYRGNIVIPPEIRLKLKISHPYQLFRLSVESKNLIKILLDSSSMNRGVFRAFSPHPFSRLVSIPIYDLEKREFIEELLDRDQLIENAKIKNVLEKLDKEDIALYLQKPSTITRSHVRTLLRPDKLFPSFSVLLRFGTTHAIERTPPSFAFWYRFYELRSFYKHVEDLVFNLKASDFSEEVEFIENLAERLRINTVDRIIELVHSFIMLKKMSFPIFKDRLETLYYMHFFFELRSNMFFQDEEAGLIELFKNEMSFNNFLNQAEILFNMAVQLIFDIKIREAYQKQAAKKLYEDVSSLMSLTKYFLEDIKYDPDLDGKEEKLIRTIYLVNKLYFSVITFVRDFNNLIEERRIYSK